MMKDAPLCLARTASPPARRIEHIGKRLWPGREPRKSTSVMHALGLACTRRKVEHATLRHHSALWS